MIHQSRCGLDCDTCENREKCDCAGCLDLEEGNWAGSCEIKKCCEERQYEHCGVCPDFPCEVLRNTSFDEDNGDDGERLITLKRWAEEKPDAVGKSRSLVVVGFSIGTVAGAIFGALTGSLGAVTICGALAGAAIGIMIDIAKKK